MYFFIYKIHRFYIVIKREIKIISIAYSHASPNNYVKIGRGNGAAQGDASEPAAHFLQRIYLQLGPAPVVQFHPHTYVEGMVPVGPKRIAALGAGDWKIEGSARHFIPAVREPHRISTTGRQQDSRIRIIVTNIIDVIREGLSEHCFHIEPEPAAKAEFQAGSKGDGHPVVAMRFAIGILRKALSFGGQWIEHLPDTVDVKCPWIDVEDRKTGKAVGHDRYLVAGIETVTQLCREFPEFGIEAEVAGLVVGLALVFHIPAGEVAPDEFGAYGPMIVELKEDAPAHGEVHSGERKGDVLHLTLVVDAAGLPADVEVTLCGGGKGQGDEGDG